MACCGNNRVIAQTTNSADGSSLPPRPERYSVVYFQYIGNTGLTVIGRETRKFYRFDSPGAIVAVDSRDRRAMIAVPTLRQVEKSTKAAGES